MKDIRRFVASRHWRHILVSRPTALLLLPIAMVVATPPLQAQPEQQGLLITRDDRSRVKIKDSWFREWSELESLARPVRVDDSLIVVKPGGIVLSDEEGKSITLEKVDTLRVGDRLPTSTGLIDGMQRIASQALRTLGALLIRQPRTVLKTNYEFVHRSEYRPPSLLFRAEEPTWRVAADSLRLVWIPGTSPVDTLMRIRIHEGVSPDSCAGGSLVLDTLAVGTIFPAGERSIGLRANTRYRIVLADSSGSPYDIGCFTAATTAERETLAAKIAELRQDLGGENQPSADMSLHVAGLFVHEGYYYDAFAALHRLRERDPNDPGLQAIWGALLADTDVLGAEDR